MVFGRARLRSLKTEFESVRKAAKGQAKEKARASKGILETVPKGGMNRKPHAQIGHGATVSASTALHAVTLTMGKKGDVIRLDVDPKTHLSWTGVHRLLDSGGQLAKFNKRFSTFGLKN